MRGRYGTYTFVIEFMGGTYVRQASGESPELALRNWLRLAGERELEWAQYRVELLRALIDRPAVPIEGCRNVWCVSGLAGEHLFLIHIIGTDSGSAGDRRLAEAQRIGSDVGPLRRGSYR